MENAAAASSVPDASSVESSPGSSTDPLWTAIPMTILYAVLLITGVIGNVLTCVVIVRNRYMHTATNYYLFSLAISDLLLLVLGLPQEIYQIWHTQYVFGEAVCILRGFSSEASTNASILTITAFTVERYVAICHPLKAHTMSTLSRAIKLIVIIWVLGFLCAAPIAYQFGIVYQTLPGEQQGAGILQSAACNIKRLIPYLEEHIFALQSLIMFVLPVTWISILYTLIGIKLRQSSRQTGGGNNSVHVPDVGGAAGGGGGRRTRRPMKLRSVSVKNQQQQQKSSSSFISMMDKPIDVGQSTAAAKPPQGLINVELNLESKTAKTKLVPETNDITTTTTVANNSHPHSYKNGNGNNNGNSGKNRKKSSSNKLKTTKSSSGSTMSNNNMSSASGNSLAQRRAVIKMLTAVVVAFFVCFAPFHAQRLMAIYVKNPSQYETFAFTLLTYISGVTYYLSATINPILYSIMSVRFRQAFHDTFVRTFCASISEQINHHRSRRYTTNSTMTNASKNSQHQHQHHHHHSAYYTPFNHNHNSIEQGKNKSNIAATATATSVTVVGTTTIVGIKKQLTNNCNNNNTKNDVHVDNADNGSNNVNNNDNNNMKLDHSRIEEDGRTSKPEL